MIFGRLDSGLAIDAVLVSGGWLRSIQTGLDSISNKVPDIRKHEIPE
jgi:hypothetical protein